MKTLLTHRPKVWILSVVTLLGLAFVASPNVANAGGPHSHGHSGHSHYRGYGSGPIYHGPSLHYDRVYHPTQSHWTPSRGWHTHGHYDVVPHYTPGHFDYKHGNHIHTNPWFH